MNTKLFIFFTSLFVSLKSQDQCGISGTDSGRPTGLIFNGESAQDRQWPWAVALYLNDGKYRNYFCSGTLISDRFVLTGELMCVYISVSQTFLVHGTIFNIFINFCETT